MPTLITNSQCPNERDWKIPGQLEDDGSRSQQVILGYMSEQVLEAQRSLMQTVRCEVPM